MDALTFAMVLTAAFTHALWNLFTKKGQGSPVVLLFWAQLFVGLAALPLSLYFTDLSNAETSWIWLIITTGAVHAAYSILLGLGYRKGDMSVIYPVSRSSAIILTASGSAILGLDALTTIGVLGLAIIAVGAATLASDELRSRGQLPAVLIALTIGCTICTFSLVDGHAMQEIPAGFYVAIMHIISPLLMLPYLLSCERREVLKTWRNEKQRALTVGCIAIATYFLILTAFKFAPTAYVVALRETSVVFAFFLGTFVLKERATLSRCAGVILIVIGAAVLKLA